MKPSLLLLAAPVAAAAATVDVTDLPTAPAALFANPPDLSRFPIPSAYESAVLGRRILALGSLGTLSTVFPARDAHDAGAGGDDSAALAGVPIGMMDYVADCEPDAGNPTILAISIATTFRNVRAGSNLSLAMRWTPPFPPARRIAAATHGSWSAWLRAHLPRPVVNALWGAPDAAPPASAYSAANLPRFSLLGRLEPIAPDPAGAARLARCFTATHPDARYWLPGNPIHRAEWARLVVERVYWVGGFGDRAYIGWIPLEDWQRVTRDEWEAVQLPGEKPGWKEWRVDEL